MCVCACPRACACAFVCRVPGSGTINKAPPAEVDVHAALAREGDMLPRKVFFSVLESVQAQHKSQLAFVKQQNKYECERLNRQAQRHAQEVQRLKRQLAALKSGSAATPAEEAHGTALVDSTDALQVTGPPDTMLHAVLPSPPPPLPAPPPAEDSTVDWVPAGAVRRAVEGTAVGDAPVLGKAVDPTVGAGNLGAWEGPGAGVGAGAGAASCAATHPAPLAAQRRASAGAS